MKTEPEVVQEQQEEEDEEEEKKSPHLLGIISTLIKIKT